MGSIRPVRRTAKTGGYTQRENVPRNPVSLVERLKGGTHPRRVRAILESLKCHDTAAMDVLNHKHFQSQLGKYEEQNRGITPNDLLYPKGGGHHKTFMGFLNETARKLK